MLLPFTKTPACVLCPAEIVVGFRLFVAVSEGAGGLIVIVCGTV